MSKNIFISGANRGLGLGFVKSSLDKGYTVFAGCRSPEKAEDLIELTSKFKDRLYIINLNPTQLDSIQKAVIEVKSKATSIDILVNNAGINSKSSGVDPVIHLQFGKLQAEPMLAMFHLNSIAPIIMAQEFVELLTASGKGRVINISSWFSSLSIPQKGNYTYSASKTALNMLTKILANDLTILNIISFVVNPGWMKTDMGGKNANLDPADSAKNILEFSEKLNIEDAGKFFNHDGTEHPW
ncbi:MAG: SDR family oxidoreductase [Leptospiraceae bacterium]|nr:SDR family oxidoreductase [Leptospiraceae bacterium]